MQIAQYGARDDLFALQWLSPQHWLAWNSLPKTLVKGHMVEVFLVLLHRSIQMSLAQDQKAVQSEHDESRKEPSP